MSDRSCRTTTRARARACCAGCTTSCARMPQGKLVRVVRGAVFDVAVDIRAVRRPSASGRASVELSENTKLLWIPPGFAHGFFVLSDSADFLYKTTRYYAPQHERCLAWDDPSVGVVWPLDGLAPTLSEKDQQGVSLTEATPSRDESNALATDGISDLRIKDSWKFFRRALPTASWFLSDSADFLYKTTSLLCARARALPRLERSIRGSQLAARRCVANALGEGRTAVRPSRRSPSGMSPPRLAPSSCETRGKGSLVNGPDRLRSSPLPTC